MARPHVADGEERLQIWRVTVNILNKQTLTADKGWILIGLGKLSWQNIKISAKEDVSYELKKHNT
jgi:hypothetical protein